MQLRSGKIDRICVGFDRYYNGYGESTNQRIYCDFRQNTYTFSGTNCSPDLEILVFGAQVHSLVYNLQDAKEVFRHVKRWSKFSELLKVLNGSLKDIDDRWADGKGPLAQEFTAEQMKHLIRALFQPTDRRSALLSRIK